MGHWTRIPTHCSLQILPSKSYKPKLNENCVDDLLGKICNEQCVGILVQCTIGCESDSVCISNCAREEAKCIDSCPCHTECFDGCEGCDHYLCNQVGDYPSK